MPFFFLRDAIISQEEVRGDALGGLLTRTGEQEKKMCPAFFGSLEFRLSVYQLHDNHSQALHVFAQRTDSASVDHEANAAFSTSLLA